MKIQVYCEVIECGAVVKTADAIEIFDENGDTVYTVEGKLDWGHCLHVLDADGCHVGTVKEKIYDPQNDDR